MTRWSARLAAHARPEAGALGAVLVLDLLALVVEALKPWPLKLIIDVVLGGLPLPRGAGWIAALPGGPAAVGLLAWLTAGTVLLFLAGWTLRVCHAYVQSGAGTRLAYGLGAELFARLQQLSLRYHGRRPSGDLVRRVMNDTACVKELVLDVAVPLVVAVASLTLMFAVLWRLDRSLSLVALAAMPALALSIVVAARPMERLARDQMDRQGDVMAVAERALSALPVVRAFVQEDAEDRRFREAVTSAKRATLRSTAAQLRFKTAGASITALGTAAVLMLGGLHVLDGILTVGDLLIFVAYVAALYGPMETLAYLSASYASAAAGARRVFDVLDEHQDIRDRPGAVSLRAGTAAEIRFERVSAGYDPGRPVLQDIDLVVRAGEVVALVGPTGAGKTTLASLIPRLLDVTDGRVLVDGQDVRDLRLRSLRSQVAIVLQEPFILPVSVAENIAYGSPHASLDAIHAAAQAAGAAAFVERLPESYDTVLAGRGMDLSGGERQRLAIARALLKNAPILILDEPTSAVDAETEASILEALARLTRTRTTVIIAHRMATVRRADRIVVLDRGSVVQTGTHEGLLRAGGLYADFYRTQFGNAGAPQTDGGTAAASRADR